MRSGLPTMMNEGDIVAHRMLAGKRVLVSGDGTTLTFIVTASNALKFSLST